LFGSADTLFGGSISRKQVAQVVADACFLSEADNKIVEIISTPDALYTETKQALSNLMT